MKIYYLLSSLLFLSLFFACSPSLDEEQANYILESTHAKDKNYKRITSDTLIFKANDYFVKNNITDKAAWSNFYCGRVLQERNKPDDAMNSYLKAETFAREAEDEELLGTIHFFMGNIYFSQHVDSAAQKKLKSALEITQKYGNNYKREISIYNKLGNSYLRKKLNEEALENFNKAMVLAEKHKDTVCISDINGNLSVYHLRMGDLIKSKEHLQKSINQNKDKHIRQYYNLSKIFYDMNKKDSALHYAIIAKNLSDIKNTETELKMGIHNLLSSLEEEQGNYSNALISKKDQMKHLSSILSEKRASDILIIEEKYNYEQLQNRNNRLVIEKQKAYMGILVLVLFIIAMMFYVYWRINKSKNHTLELEMKNMKSLEKLRVLENMAEGFNEKEKSLRTEVLSHYEIMRKVALLQEDDQLNDRTKYKKTPLQRINDIVYGGKQKPDWDVFFDSIRNLHGDTIEKINFNFPNLDNIERKICYLAYMNFSNYEMSTLLGYTFNTIVQKKTNVRRKLGISDRKNIKNYLDNYFKKLTNPNK